MTSQTTHADPVILEMRSITKEFPGVKALSNVSLRVKAGEIHAICGENGAGKSTLMKVLSGVYPYGSYDGDIVYQGQVQQFRLICTNGEVHVPVLVQFGVPAIKDSMVRPGPNAALNIFPPGCPWRSSMSCLRMNRRLGEDIFP